MQDNAVKNKFPEDGHLRSPGGPLHPAQRGYSAGNVAQWMEAITGTVFAFATRMQHWPLGCILHAHTAEIHQRGEELADKIWQMMRQMGWPMTEARYRQEPVTIAQLFGNVPFASPQTETSMRAMTVPPPAENPKSRFQAFQDDATPNFFPKNSISIQGYVY